MVDCSQREEIYSAAKKVRFHMYLEICPGGARECAGDGRIHSVHRVIKKHCGLCVWLVTDLEVHCALETWTSVCSLVPRDLIRILSWGGRDGSAGKIDGSTAKYACCTSLTTSICKTATCA